MLMPGETSDEQIIVEHPKPFCLPTTVDVDSTIKLEIEHARNPLPHGTLGDIGLATKVEGPFEFAQHILMQPFQSHTLKGIDPTSVRVFRWDEHAGTLRPIWNSGINVAFGFIWAKIRRPGVYVPLGLPRDRVLRGLLQMLARQRHYVDTGSQEEMKALTTHVLSVFLETSQRELNELRQLLTRMELQTSLDPYKSRDLTFGRGGSIQAFPLPRGVTLETFKERLRNLETPLNGLPEENLFSLPEALEEPEPPWPLPFPQHWPVPIPIPLPLPKPFPPFPFPPPWWCWLQSRDWPMYHHDVRHSGHASGCSNITSTTVGSMYLRATVPVDGEVITIPSIAHGHIYVGTGNSTNATGASGGTLYKIDLSSGTVDASFTFSTPPGGGSEQGYAGVGSSPAIYYGKVYFSGLDGKIYCLDSGTLSLVWSTDLRNAQPSQNQPVSNTQAECWTSPLVIHGKVYVGCGVGEGGDAFGFVYCLDANTGCVIWLFCTNQFNSGTDNLPNVIPSSAVGAILPNFSSQADPHVSGGTIVRGASVWSSVAYDAALHRVYVGTGNPNPDSPLPNTPYASGVLSLDADTGQFRGFFQPSQSDNYQASDNDIDVPSSPMIFNRYGTDVLAIGTKGGAFFLLDPNTMTALAHRQLLPYDINGNPFPGIDGGPTTIPHENAYGVFGTAAVHYGLGRIFVGLGGYGGQIDRTTTPFMRTLDWNTLNDVWITSGNNPPMYTVPQPPMYTTDGEAGLSSPAVVNDVVFVSTTKPGLYALDAASGLCLWSAGGLSPTYIMGPAISGNSVIIGTGSTVNIYSL
jgi:outer membrane protein assembly factor BamB